MGLRALWRLSASAVPALTAAVSLSSWAATELDRAPAAGALPKPTRNRWISSKHVDKTAADSTVSSVFTLLFHVPRVHALPEDVQHLVVPPSALQAGFAVRYGTAVSMQQNPNLTHYKLKPLLGARILLCAHWRGAPEVPGGHRDAVLGGKELCAVAAERELVEEAGVTLAAPLSWETDAAAVMLNDDGSARWVLFARELDGPSFDAAVSAGPSASTYLVETYGNIAAHAILTLAAGSPGNPARRVYGLPRTLALQAPWQANMVLAGLEAVGVLHHDDVVDMAEEARVWKEAGGAGGGEDGLPLGGLTPIHDVAPTSPALLTRG